MDDVFAAGDLGEALKAMEEMEAAGLEAAGARDKLNRVMTAMKKVMHCPPLTHVKRAVLHRLVSCMFSLTYSSHGFLSL